MPAHRVPLIAGAINQIEKKDSGLFARRSLPRSNGPLSNVSGAIATPCSSLRRSEFIAAERSGIASRDVEASSTSSRDGRASDGQSALSSSLPRTRRLDISAAYKGMFYEGEITR